MDPEFTVAYAGLAYTLILMGVYDLVPIGEVLPEAKEAISMAIAEYKKSIEVDANQLIAYQWLSWAYHSNRMYPEAINAIGEYLKILKREDLATAIKNTFDESGYIQAIRKLIGVSKQDFSIIR